MFLSFMIFEQLALAL